MKNITLFSCCIFGGFLSFAQPNPAACSPEFQAKVGTYEIVSHTKRTEVFTTEILCQIESRRDDKKIIEWEVSEYTTIRIQPRIFIIHEETK